MIAGAAKGLLCGNGLESRRAAQDDLVAFRDHLHKRRRSNRIAGIVATLSGVVAVVWGFSTTGDRTMARMGVLGAACLAVGPLVFGLTFRASKGLEAVRSPERIVWFYGAVRGQYVTGVLIGTADGKLHRMPVPSLKEGPTAIALLRQVAPHATEGFSEAVRVKFRNQPESLRKTPCAAA